jgi:two-component system cell cycle response regulator
MKVLVAHAKDDARRAVRELLEPLGHDVHDCACAEEALVACADWAPDVTLVDDELCRRDGMALLTAIKSDVDAYRTAVIVIVDGEVGLADAMDEIRRGAHDVLREPLEPGEVVARVHAAGRTKSLQEELLGQADRLEQLIFEDPLTGLFNRRAILVQLEALMSGARRHARPMSIVMIDIDHFKAFNDTHGHPVGDRVLRSVSEAMGERLRTEDFLGRLGGEEFLALLPDTDATDAARVAEDLRECVSAIELDAEAGAITVTASVGWATWQGEGPEALVKRADRALYAAKGAGRNTVKGDSEPAPPATLRRRS